MQEQHVRSPRSGSLDRLINEHVRAVLDSFAGRTRPASEHLGVSQRWLQYWIKQWGYVAPARSPADEVAERMFAA